MATNTDPKHTGDCERDVWAGDCPCQHNCRHCCEPYAAHCQDCGACPEQECPSWCEPQED